MPTNGQRVVELEGLLAALAPIPELTVNLTDEDLDWNFADAKTQYLTHSIHRYSGKYIPQIARQAIELLTVPGDLILDPYCGSGTTLLESALVGRRSVGIDLNPLAVLISRVKTTPVERAVLDDFVVRMETAIRLLAQNDDSRWTNQWYVKWFQDHARLELIQTSPYHMGSSPLCV